MVIIRKGSTKEPGSFSFSICGGCFRTVLTFLAGSAFAAVLFQMNDAQKNKADATATAGASPTDFSRDLSTTSSAPDFLEIGKRTGTDKVSGGMSLPACLNDPKNCRWPEAVNPQCRVYGHYYHTLYNQWLRPLWERSEPYSALEIGFYNGNGYDAFSSYLSSSSTGAVTMHSMEISCIEEGPRDQGKWPWGNFASKHPRYQELIDHNLLHCGDASQYAFLKQTWTNKIQNDTSPLLLVIDDGAHLAAHMAVSLFFWFQRIAPGGLLIVEDIEPLSPANAFRQHVLPQVVKDLHFCGNDANFKDDKPCFPTIQAFLHAVYCEMHICVFQRNDKPAAEPSETDSMPPKHALDAQQCLFR